MSMSAAELADWESRMDTAIAAYETATAAVATLTDSADADTAATYEAALATAQAAVTAGAAAIDALNAEYTGAAAEPWDTTPPTVVSTSPADGATGVALAATITVTFSKAMSQASITSASLYVAQVGGSTLDQTADPVLSTNKKTATITLVDLLPSGHTFRIRAAATCADKFSNPMTGAFRQSTGFAT